MEVRQMTASAQFSAYVLVIPAMDGA